MHADNRYHNNISKQQRLYLSIHTEQRYCYHVKEYTQRRYHWPWKHAITYACRVISCQKNQHWPPNSEVLWIKHAHTGIQILHVPPTVHTVSRLLWPTVRRVASETTKDDQHVVDIQLSHDLVGPLLWWCHRLCTTTHTLPHLLCHRLCTTTHTFTTPAIPSTQQLPYMYSDSHTMYSLTHLNQKWNQQL